MRESIVAAFEEYCFEKFDIDDPPPPETLLLAFLNFRGHILEHLADLERDLLRDLGAPVGINLRGLNCLVPKCRLGALEPISGAN